jgi:hypothetical protein
LPAFHRFIVIPIETLGKAINMDGKTRAELARELQIGRVSLWRWEKAGAIPAATPVSGNRSIYPPETARAIRKFVESQR